MKVGLKVDGGLNCLVGYGALLVVYEFVFARDYVRVNFP